MTVTVIVPWRAGCSHREAAWAWLRDRYDAIYPGWALCEAHAPPGPWVKASAVNPAVREADSDIVAIVDADVWCDGLATAVEAVDSGAPWAMPHSLVHRLTEDATAALLAGDDRWTDLEQPPYRGVEGGGIVVLRRETALDIPLDPRFVGWGQEDESWALALHYLLGPAWRGTAQLLHLYHPPQERLNRRRGSTQGWQLRRRYLKARNDPDQMRALLAEAAQ